MTQLAEAPAARGPRTKSPLANDLQLGGVSALAEYLNVSRSWLTALKECSRRRHSSANPSCFSGNKSNAKWVLEWLERNRDFEVRRSKEPAFPQSPQPLA